VDQNEPFLKVLIYGEPGVGKTRAAGSADAVEALSPVLFVDIEGGTYSLRKAFPNVQRVRVQSMDEMQRVYDQLRRGTNYKTVVLDSLTEIQKFSMDKIMEAAHAKDPDKIDIDAPQLQQWGRNTEQTRRLIRAFRDLPMHVIATALVHEERDPRSNIIIKRPFFQGQLRQQAPGFFDLVLYMYKTVSSRNGETTVKRLMLTMGTDTCVAKDRSDTLPPVITDPDIQTIFNYTQGVVE
jgi:hypothetical protein